MTNAVAIWMGLAVVALFVADWLWLDWDVHILVGQQFLRLIDYLAFWR